MRRTGRGRRQVRRRLRHELQLAVEAGASFLEVAEEAPALAAGVSEGRRAVGVGVGEELAARAEVAHGAERDRGRAAQRGVVVLLRGDAAHDVALLACARQP